MSASFPTSIKNFLQLQDGVDNVIAQHPNERGDEVTAIQTLLGALGASQSYSESYKNLLLYYKRGAKLDFKSAADLYVRAGEMVLTDGAGNVRFRRNTSDTTVTWADLDTGAEANATYYVYAVADTSGTTFGIKISTSSSAPSGATFYRALGTFVNSAGDISAGSIVTYGETPYFGAWLTRTQGTIYQAATDGFVVATDSSGVDVVGLSDSNSSPTTQRTRNQTNLNSGICMPVKRNDYWKVTGGGSTTLYWIPLGSTV